MAALAVLGAAALPHSARAQSAVTYTPGDLFLSFRASDGVGATQNYVVNLGQASGFGATGSSAVVTAAGDIATDLTTLFGADWKTRSDVFWSVSGTVGSFSPVGSDPAKTLYATREELVPGTLATAWLRRSDSSQGVTTSKMNAMANAYAGKTSTAANSKAIIQSTSAANSYASFQRGGTLPNSGPAPGISFAAFNPTIEGSFAFGTARSVLDLVRLVPASGADVETAGGIVGRFTLSDSGELRYTPAAAVGASSVAVALSSYSVAETAGTVGVKLVRSGDPSTAFTVNVSTANGTAIAGTDYTALSSVPVSFDVNQTEATVPVSILNVPGTQADRAFTVSIASPSGGATLGAQTSASVTISDAVVNSQIAFSASTYAFNAVNAAAEPNSLSVQLTRTGGSTGSVAIGVAVTGGTLVNGTDYQTYNPTIVTFADGVTTATTTIQLNALTGGGTIVLGLSNPTGGAGLGAPASATLNVTAFSGTLSFASATYQKAEGTGDVTVQVSVTRGLRSVGAVSAEVAVSGGTALANLDYTLPGSIVLSWANGDNTPKTFDVTIKADTIPEAAGETVVLELRNLVGGAILGRDATTTLTIVDGDAKLPTLSVLKPSSNGTVTGSEAIVSGKATDNIGVPRVEVKLNNGSAQLATLAGSATNRTWSLSLLPEQGLNTLEVTAYDPAGNASAKVTRKFTFKNLRPALAGSYNGLLVAGAGATSQIDQNGLVNITVTSTGSFTGRVTIAGVSQAISGVFKNDGSAAFGKTSTPTVELVKTLKPAKVSLGFLALTLDTGSGNKVTGALKDAAGAVTFASVVADKALYTAAKNPSLPLRNVPQAILDPAREKGKYTALFQAAVSPNSGVAKTGFPQGDGYAMVTVSTSGKVTMVGKLADGSAVSYSNALSSANDWPVYVQLYGKKGFVAGNVRFDSTQTTSDAACLAMKWFKPAGIASPKIYTAGWPNGILTDFVASKFIPTGKPTSKVPVPPNPDTVLGVGVPGASGPTVANVLIGVADGGLTAATGNEGSLSAVNKLTVLGAASGQTAANGLKASFNAGSGALSGSFVHPGTNKPVSFAGVVYQKQNLASGFFLYTPPASNPSAIPESGSVSVSKK